MLGSILLRIHWIRVLIFILISTFYLPTHARTWQPSQEQAQWHAQNQMDLLYLDLQQQEALWAGDLHFDLWLGQTALAIAQPASASWALERSVLVAPNHIEARLLLTQAYIDLERWQQAEHQLARLEHLPLNTQQQTHKAILHQQLLAHQSRLAHAWRLTGQASAGLGFDSNVSSASGTRLITATDIFVLKEESSLFSQLALRHRLRYRQDPQWQFSAGYQLRDRRPFSYSEQARSQLRIEAEASYQKPLWQITLQPALARGWRDGQQEITETQLSLFGLYQPSQQHSWLGYLQYIDLDYAELNAQDGHLLILGGQRRQHHTLFERHIEWYLGGFYLLADQAQSPQGDFQGPGLQLGLSAPLLAGWQGRSQVHFSWRDYQCPSHPAECDAQRQDQLLRLDLSAHYSWAPHWHLEPQFSYIYQSSDDPVADYQRFLFLMSIRYDFTPRTF
ncbi:hypothetical protein [Marinospirillum sp.]|uniref:hypothetical protein n=1 Tax=Marinospirillum sp. TaxID=2183934 RepID=UPI003A89CAFC